MIIWGNPIILKSGKTIFNPTTNKNNFWVDVGANNANTNIVEFNSLNSLNSNLELVNESASEIIINSQVANNLKLQLDLWSVETPTPTKDNINNEIKLLIEGSDSDTVNPQDRSIAVFLNSLDSIVSEGQNDVEVQSTSQQNLVVNLNFSDTLINNQINDSFSDLENIEIDISNSDNSSLSSQNSSQEFSISLEREYSVEIFSISSEFIP